MIYIMSNSKHLKIGKSRDPMKRLQSLQTGSSEPLSLEACFRVFDDGLAEKKLHEHFKERRLHGEWFLVTVHEIIQAITQLNLLYQNENQIEMFFDKPFTQDKDFIDWLRSIEYHDVSWWELFEKGRPLRQRQRAFDYMESMYLKYQQGSHETNDQCPHASREIMDRLKALMDEF